MPPDLDRRDAKVWWLGVMGWTQAEIAEVTSADQKHTGRVLGIFSDLKKSLNDQYTRGRSITEIAESEGVPDKLIEVALLDGKDDAERMAYL